VFRFTRPCGPAERGLSVFEQGGQFFIALGKLQADGPPRVLTRQGGGSLAPPMCAIPIDRRVPVFGHWWFGTPSQHELIGKGSLVQRLFKGEPRWGGMDRAELLRRASRYRDLAAGIPDEQTREGLLNLAERYEALASEIDEGSGGHSDD
jgi:hypothetical protein